MVVFSFNPIQANDDRMLLTYSPNFTDYFLSAYSPYTIKYFPCISVSAKNTNTQRAMFNFENG